MPFKPKDHPKKKVIPVLMHEKHRRIVRLAKILFGTHSYEVIGAAIELYEKKFRVLETARKFMEDGVLKDDRRVDSMVDVTAAKIAAVHERIDAGIPLSIFDKPIPHAELEELLKD